MPETVIGSIYPAALIGRTPLIGSIYMPYRLIFTSEQVIAFYPDPQKAFRSGFKLFKAYNYREVKWKKLVEEVGSNVVFNGKEGINDEMLKTDEKQGYGSMPYSKIGGVLLKAGSYGYEFEMSFKLSEAVIMRGLQFVAPRSALADIKTLLGKTPLSNKIESQL